MSKKNEKTPVTRKDSTPIKVWVLPEEKKLVEKKAEQHGLSTSAYVRNVSLGLTMKSTIDKAAIADLAKINADIGRFGGLLKMWLNNDERLRRFGREKSAKLIETAFLKIDELQSILLEKVKKL